MFWRKQSKLLQIGRLGKGTLAVISSVLKGYFTMKGHGVFFIKEAHRESFYY